MDLDGCPRKYPPVIDFEMCLGQAGSAFSALLREESLDVAIPSCPGWVLADLARHLVGVFDFAATAVVEGRESDVVPPAVDLRDLPSSFDGGLRRMQTALAGADAALPCWTMAPPANAGFWKRRMTHETWLHLWDAESAVSRTPTSMPPELAADGVLEVVEMFYPRQVRLGRIPPLRDRLRMEMADVHGSPVLFLPDADAPGPADATVVGSAHEVLLLLWGRRTAETAAIQTLGDTTALQRVLSTAVTP